MKKMKKQTLVIGIVAMVMLSVAILSVTAEFTLTEDVIYAEGIGLDGLEVTPSGTFPATIVGPATNVMLDWSDNIVFHQYPAGQKLRTEVILHNIDAETLDPAVFTLTAHLMIEKIDGQEGDPVGDPLYSSSIAEGVWALGPNDYYSAEVNQEGKLLYGYNWETRDLDPGWYRLTFWLEKDYTCPEGITCEEHTVDITSGDPGDTDTSKGTIYGFVSYDLDNEKSSIDIELLEKTKGRR